MDSFSEMLYYALFQFFVTTQKVFGEFKFIFFVYSIILFVFERLITRVTPGTNVQFIIENVESKEGD